MKTRSIFLAIVVLLISMTSLQAQRPPRFTPEERAKQLKEKLQLTDEQTQKITVILKDSQDRMKAAMDSAQGDRAKLRESRKDEMKKVDDQIKAVLTKDQAAKYEELQAQMMKARKEKQEQKEAAPEK